MTARRDFLAFTAGAVVARAILPAVARATPSVAEADPDASLIRTCAEHLVNRDAFNTSPDDVEYEDDPLWVAYERTRIAIDRAKPQTLEGMRAKARCAKAEAMMPNGREVSDGGPQQKWAWDLVNDLVSGSVAA